MELRSREAYPHHCNRTIAVCPSIIHLNLKEEAQNPVWKEIARCKGRENRIKPFLIPVLVENLLTTDLFNLLQHLPIRQ